MDYVDVVIIEHDDGAFRVYEGDFNEPLDTFVTIDRALTVYPAAYLDVSQETEDYVQRMEDE